MGGGRQNTSSGDTATLGGGNNNISIGLAATVPGGDHNLADGEYSFAAGRQAKANHTGAFVWVDSTGLAFASTANNQFLIRATGGVGINTNNPNGAALAVNGAVTATSSTGNGVQGKSLSAGASGVYGENLTGTGYGVGGRATVAGMGVYGDNLSPAGFAGYFNGNVHVNGALTPMSDRNVKRDFAAVDSREVLEQVARLAVQTWAYTNSGGVRHIGPVAQDFQAAFHLGADDKTIATVDADGVALAAIQGLNQKVEGEVTALRAENAELKQRLEKLERLVNRENGGVK